MLKSLLIFIAINLWVILPAANYDVVPADSVCVINSVALSGNKITKDKIIIRELEFFVGERLSVKELDSLILQSEQNLLNRSLFNFVTITKSGDPELVNIEVDVVERWYVWPIPIMQFADRNINSWWQKRSWNRINYGVDLRVDNFRGMMENLNITAQGGYDVLFGFKWSIPYLTEKQVFGMTFEGGIQRNHEISYVTTDNKPEYFYSNHDFVQKKYYGNVAATFRPGYNYLHSFSLRYSNFAFLDTIQKLNPNFAYGDNSYQYFSISYSFKLDYRDYKPYPLIGHYFDIGIQKTGLGLLGSDIDILSLSANFDQYFRLYKRWYFAYNLGGLVSSRGNPPPYFIKSGLGYNPFTIRGYELYVVDGLNLAVYKSNLKFELLPKTDFHINWIRTTKFNKIFFALYANVFFDAGYVKNLYSESYNPLENQFLWSTGVGLDVISYYDVVVRFEFSVNKQHNQGFFIEFVSPI